MASRRLLAGLLLLILGISGFAVTIFSHGSEVPRDATWIFLPQEMLRPQPVPDYSFTSVTLRLDLTNSSGPMLQVEFWLSVFNLTRIYGLGILQPLGVVQKRATASVYPNTQGSASTPITTVTPLGTYFTRSFFKFNSYGTPSIVLNVPLSDAITFWAFGRRGTGFTFGSGYGIRAGAEVDQFMIETNEAEILNHGLTLSATYPPSWQLSLPETFPFPDKEFGVGQDRAATWWLNFTAPILRNYFVTVTLVWAIAEDLMWRDWISFGSGVAIAIASGVVTESTRRGWRQRAEGTSKDTKREGTIADE